MWLSCCRNIKTVNRWTVQCQALNRLNLEIPSCLVNLSGSQLINPNISVIFEFMIAFTVSTTDQAHKRWLNSFNNIKRISDSSVLRLTHESITNFVSLSDFDKKSTQFLPNIFKNIICAFDADTTNITRSEAIAAGASPLSWSVGSSWLLVLQNNMDLFLGLWFPATWATRQF